MIETAKLIRKQLQEIIGMPVTPEEIKKFNDVYNNCVDEYKRSKKMPVDFLSEFEKILEKKPDA